MGKNTNTAPKSFAEEGLEDIQILTAQAEASVPVGTTAVGEDDGEWEDLGTNEPVAYYFRTSAPRKVTAKTAPFRVLAPGDIFTGEYLRKHIGGKYNSPTYFIRLTEGEDAGKLVGISGYFKGGDTSKPSGSLSKQLEKVEPGTVLVRVQYMGQAPMKSGEYEGTDAHKFIVRSKRKA